MMADEKQKNSEIIAVYRASPMNQFVAIIILGIAVFSLLSGNADIAVFIPETVLEGLIIVVFVGVLLVLLTDYIFIIIRNKLILRTDRIDWHHMGQDGSASWSELSHFDVRKMPLRNNGVRLWGVYTIDEKFIPIEHYISLFTMTSLHHIKLQKFSDTDAGGYFYTRVPHLFDDLKKKKT